MKLDTTGWTLTDFYNCIVNREKEVTCLIREGFTGDPNDEEAVHRHLREGFTAEQARRFVCIQLEVRDVILPALMASHGLTLQDLRDLADSWN